MSPESGVLSGPTWNGSTPRFNTVGAGLTGGDAVRVRDDLKRLAAELEKHFDREERYLVSALNSL
ncbi:MAG: hypothetical protein M0026_00390 [Nocardiopsaceae bacterium]|nr:hypothetical protein [Nocardiopsaceae bacterium]